MTEETTEMAETPQPEVPKEEVRDSKEEIGPRVEGPDKYKRDLLIFKEKWKEAEARAQELAQKIESSERQTLEEKQNFKELWERAEQKAKEAEAKATSIQESYLEGLKRSTIERELSKAGVKPEYLEVAHKLENGLVNYESDGTEVNVIGATEFVEDLRAKFPDMFKMTGKPNINAMDPNMPSPKSYKPEELLKLQREKPEEYNRVMMQRLGKK